LRNVVKERNRKENRYKKNEKQYKSNIRKLESKNEKLQEELNILEKRYHKKERGEQYYKDKEQELIKENEELKEEIKQYQEIEDMQKEQGEYIPELRKEIKTLEEEKNQYIEKYDRKLEELERKNKEIKKHLIGNVKSVTRQKRENEKIKREVGNLGNKIGELREEKNSLRRKLKREQEFTVELRKEIYENETDISKRIELLGTELTEDTVDKYKILEDIYNEYIEIKDKVEEERGKVDDIYGYLYNKNENAYVKDIDQKDVYQVTEFNGLSVRDDLVCRISIYEDGKVKLDGTFESEQQYKEDRDKRRKYKKNKGKINVKYEQSLNGLNVVLLTEKNLQIYHKYFGDKVKILQSYGEGEKKVFKEVDKADIVMMRMDAVPHAVSNYVKRVKKEHVVFLENGNLKDAGNK